MREQKSWTLHIRFYQVFARNKTEIASNSEGRFADEIKKRVDNKTIKSNRIVTLKKLKNKHANAFAEKI